MAGILRQPLCNPWQDTDGRLHPSGLSISAADGSTSTNTSTSSTSTVVAYCDFGQQEGAIHVDGQPASVRVSLRCIGTAATVLVSVSFSSFSRGPSASLAGVCTSPSSLVLPRLRMSKGLALAVLVLGVVVLGVAAAVLWGANLRRARRRRRGKRRDKREQARGRQRCRWVVGV